MKPVDFAKALGVAILVMALDLVCAFASVFVWTLIHPPTQPLSPTDPIVIQISSLSTRICGPILFALFIWLFSRKRPDRNVWAFAVSVFLFYLVIDWGTLFLLPSDGPSDVGSKVAIMMERGVIATMALKLIGALIGAWLAKRRA